MTPSSKRCPHWAFTAARHGRRIRYRCAQPGCRRRWRTTTPTARATKTTGGER